MCIHRVDGRDVVTRWPVNDEPWGLSVTAKHNLLVSCKAFYTSSALRKLKEFTTEGQLVRQVSLDSSIFSPLHAVELSTGQFVVCHGDLGDPVNGVSLVDVDGRIQLTHSRPPGSEVGQLNVPCHVAVDDDGFILVADYNNRRVVLLSPTLNYVRDVSRDQLGSCWEPFRLCFDVDRGRLFVAVNEWKDGRWVAGQVVVFERA